MTSSAATAPSHPFTPGSVIDGKYQVEREIATGGMGVVVLASQPALDRRVAIKYLRPHALAVPGLIERFEREARLAAKIKSEHVVRVHDVGVLAGHGPYIVMEYLEGHDLGRFVEQGAIPIDQAVDYVIDACDALAEAHAAGIVHRDLKPENLFLADRSPHAPIVKIIDFGISKVAPKRGETGNWTKAEDDLGTPRYMSPEQLAGGVVDARSDIWALGVVLHELITGAPPFEGATIEALCEAIVNRAPRRLEEALPGAPPELGAILLTCLEKSPARRFDSVADLAHALVPFGSGEAGESAVRIATVVREAEAASRARPDPRRAAPTVVVARSGGPPMLGILALAIAALGLVLVVYFGVIRPRAATAVIEPGGPVPDPPATGAMTAGNPPPSPSAIDLDSPPENASATAPASTVTPDMRAKARARLRTAPGTSSKDPRAGFGERK